MKDFGYSHRMSWKNWTPECNHSGRLPLNDRPWYWGLYVDLSAVTQLILKLQFHHQEAESWEALAWFGLKTTSASEWVTNKVRQWSDQGLCHLCCCWAQPWTTNNTKGAKQCLVLSKHCHWVCVLLTEAPPTPLWRLRCVSWMTLQIHTKMLPSHVSFLWFVTKVLHLHLTLTSFSQRYVCPLEVQQRLLARKLHSGSSLIQS